MIEAIAKKALKREVVLYLFFGGIAVVLNIVLYYLFVNVIKMPIWLGNILDTHKLVNGDVIPVVNVGFCFLNQFQFLLWIIY